ncbi:MAG: preprotein translocase subunit SecE [Kangiellaceae bacterium]|jgi:preprotein translocase subunit SecE|nr:preprotein translocase subunit SecE [Kangiellaceae bacterium]|tara:strand:+ start:265 stop:645 length:381 start_codon:yes stop_codon:yes gene_type:complete
MNAKVENQESGALDSIKWVLVIALLAAAIGGNAYYAEQPLYFRVLGVVFGIGIALAIAATTTKGKSALSFAQEARTEVRKVVWPTRQETLHTTMYVLLMTALVGVMLWLMDFVLIRLIGFVTGQGA